jgi:hypothetical protein
LPDFFKRKQGRRSENHSHPQLQVHTILLSVSRKKKELFSLDKIAERNQIGHMPTLGPTACVGWKLRQAQPQTPSQETVWVVA